MLAMKHVNYITWFAQTSGYGIISRTLLAGDLEIKISRPFSVVLCDRTSIYGLVEWLSSRTSGW